MGGCHNIRKAAQIFVQNKRASEAVRVYLRGNRWQVRNEEPSLCQVHRLRVHCESDVVGRIQDALGVDGAPESTAKEIQDQRAACLQELGLDEGQERRQTSK